MTNKTISLFFLVSMIISVFNLYLVVNQFPDNGITGSSDLNMNEQQSKAIDQVVSDKNTNNKLEKIQVERTTNFEAYSTEVTTNKSEYNPGDAVHVDVASSLAGLNGSMSWSLQTPLDETVIDFKGDASRVFFDDPEFSGQTLVDWTNVSFSSAEPVQSGIPGVNYMELSTVDDSTTASLVYDKYNDIEGKFELQIDYVVVESDYKANLTFSYWNGTQFETQELSNYSNSITFDAVLNSKNAPSHLFNFTLDQSNATWQIKPILLSYNVDDIQLEDEEIHSGEIEVIWAHGPDFNTRDTLQFSFEAQSTLSDSQYAKISFTIPSQQVYFGEWQFNVEVYPVDESVSLAQHEFKVPILVTEDLVFTVNNQYIYRGTNTTSGLPVLSEETGTNIHSPTDNISLVGDIEVGASGLWKLDSKYFNSLSGYVLSNSTGLANFDLVWGTQDLEEDSSSYLNGYNYSNSLFETLIESQLPTNVNNSQSWLVNYNIPNRGLFGNANQTLYVTFPSFIKVNDTNNQTISDDYTLEIDLGSIDVRYTLNVSSSNLPFLRTWFISELMEGSVGISSWRFNASTLSSINNNDDVDFSYQLDFPLSDLNLSIGLGKVAGEFDQLIPLTLVNDLFYFSGSIDTNLDTSATYILNLKWNTPQNTSLQMLSFDKIYSYEIRGTLTVELPNQKLFFEQGSNLAVPFNLSIDQLSGKRASGLRLTAEINGASSNLSFSILEKGGTYVLMSAIPVDFETGSYTIDIVKASTNQKIGEVNVEILVSSVNPQDEIIVVPDIISFTGAILGVIVVAGFVFTVLRRR